MSALQQLAELDYQARYRDKPDYPENARFKRRYTATTANGLTRAIIDWIRLNGFFAERVNVQGRPIDRTRIATNTLGQRQRIGSIDWIPGGGTRGSADIHAVLKAGKAVYIEVKIGRDKMSKDQQQYRDQVTQAGAVYFVARDFDSFIEFYNEQIGQT
jgi:hypothetical protein